MANDPADLGMWLYILRKALESSLVMLAESRGLDWLSEFENQLIRDAKRGNLPRARSRLDR
jgi:hypothetical protein